MNEHEQKLFENLMAHNSAYYGYELSKGEIKTILQAFTELKKHRSANEKEIRNNAIDEFSEKLKSEYVYVDVTSDDMIYGKYCKYIDEIADQLKEVK